MKRVLLRACLLLLTWCSGPKIDTVLPDEKAGEVLHAVDELVQSMDSLDTIDEATQENGFESSWFSYHALPIQQTDNSITYRRAWEEVVVRFDPKSRASAVSECILQFGNVTITEDTSWLEKDWKRWCELYAFDRSSTLSFPRSWEEIQLRVFVGEGYGMLSPLTTNTWGEGNYALRIDSCNKSFEESMTNTRCIFPWQETFMDIGWWAILIAYDWSDSIPDSDDIPYCDEEFECWRCVYEDQRIQRSYCPTWPDTVRYGEQIGESTRIYVEETKAQLDYNSEDTDPLAWVVLDDIINNKTLDFEVYAQAAKNNNGRRILSDSWKTIQGWLAPSLTIDPTDSFLNPWQSALFECGESCDRDALEKEYAITPQEVCEREDGAYRFPLALQWEGSDREVLGYSIYKSWSLLTYPVLEHPGDWNTNDFDGRYLYRYNCESNKPTKLWNIHHDHFITQWFTILMATDTVVYLSLYDETCVYGCDDLTQIIEIDLNKVNNLLLDHETLNILEFEWSERWIKAQNQSDFITTTVWWYYSDQLSQWVGEMKLHMIEQNNGDVTWGVNVLSTQPNSKWIYIYDYVWIDIHFTERRVSPATF